MCSTLDHDQVGWKKKNKRTRANRELNIGQLPARSDARNARTCRQGQPQKPEPRTQHLIMAIKPGKQGARASEHMRATQDHCQKGPENKVHASEHGHDEISSATRRSKKVRKNGASKSRKVIFTLDHNQKAGNAKRASTRTHKDALPKKPEKQNVRKRNNNLLSRQTLGQTHNGKRNSSIS